MIALLSVLTVIAALAGLSILRAVFVPTLFAVFIVALALPLQELLRRWVPVWVASTLTFLVVLIVLSLFVWALWLTLDSAAGQLGKYTGQLNGAYAELQGWVSQYGISLPDRPIDSINPAQIVSQVWGFLGGVWGFVGALGITLALVALGLPAAPQAQANVRELEPNARDPLSTARSIGTTIRSYTVWTGVTCAINGVLTWVVLVLLGVDFALLWGAIAFILTVVPMVGAILSIGPPTLMALLQFDGWTTPAIVFGAMTSIQVVMGNIVEPALRSRSVRILPVVALFSLLFWSALIGISGALLAIPLTGTVVIVCREFEATRWISTLLTEPNSGRKSKKRKSRQETQTQSVDRDSFS
jgi:predicted PurR-regulated permease PerM